MLYMYFQLTEILKSLIVTTFFSIFSYRAYEIMSLKYFTCLIS